MDLQLHIENAKNANKFVQRQKIQRNEKQSGQQQFLPPRVLPWSAYRCFNNFLAADLSHVLLPSIHQAGDICTLPPDMPSYSISCAD
jgi:hypothetical protein